MPRRLRRRLRRRERRRRLWRRPGRAPVSRREISCPSLEGGSIRNARDVASDEFAAERLADLSDHDEVRRLHAEHFIALAEAAWRSYVARPRARGEPLRDRTGQLSSCAYLVSQLGPVGLDVQARSWLCAFLGEPGSFAEARTWMETTLRARESLAPEHRARYAQWAAYVAYGSGESDRAWALLEESLALSRARGDAEGEGHALMSMGHCAYDGGRLDEAVALLEQGADAFRRVGTGWGLPGVTMNLGNLALSSGDYERAEQLYTESLTAYRALESPPNVTVALVNLANLCVERGSPSQAAGPLREALRDRSFHRCPPQPCVHR